MRAAADTAVIMAGGAGLRLRPYTCVLPKPLMPLGERPIIEILMRQLCASGIRNVIVSIGRNAHLMKAVIEDRIVPGLTLCYQEEDSPLGTCGSLGLMKDHLPDRFLVINGDLLTDYPFNELLGKHSQSSAMVTLGTCLRDETGEFGVIERDSSGQLTQYVEKPSIQRELSIGAYVLEKACVSRFIRTGAAVDIPDLINELLDAGEIVEAVPSRCTWIDIGNQDDYVKAQRLFDKDPAVFAI